MILYLLCKFYGWLWGCQTQGGEIMAAMGALVDALTLLYATLTFMGRRMGET